MEDELQFRLTITAEGAAFEEPEHEIARILRETARRLEEGDGFDTYRNLLDVNGNVAGTAALKYREEHERGWRSRRRP